MCSLLAVLKGRVKALRELLLNWQLFAHLECGSCFWFHIFYIVAGQEWIVAALKDGLRLGEGCCV